MSVEYECAEAADEADLWASVVVAVPVPIVVVAVTSTVAVANLLEMTPSQKLITSRVITTPNRHALNGADAEADEDAPPLPPPPTPLPPVIVGVMLLVLNLNVIIIANYKFTVMTNSTTSSSIWLVWCWGDTF